jgi:hypothetical protein
MARTSRASTVLRAEIKARELRTMSQSRSCRRCRWDPLDSLVTHLCRLDMDRDGVGEETELGYEMSILDRSIGIEG